MNKSRLKIWELSLLIALCLSLCAGAWAQARQEELSASLVRLHVIAVSDDETEQRIKLDVRDAVLSYMAPRLDGARSAEEARRILNAELDGIAEAAREASRGRPVSVTLSREYYPTRLYEGFALPAGEYESLRVVLGEGRGHNWWCVVFPPLCVSAAEQRRALDTMSGELRGIVSDDDGGYVIRFRIVELWGELRRLVG